MEIFAQSIVSKTAQEKFLRFLSPAKIRQGLMEKSQITHFYKIRRQEQEVYVAVQIAAIKHPDNLLGHGLHSVGIGIKDVDADIGRAVTEYYATGQ